MCINTTIVFCHRVELSGKCYFPTYMRKYDKFRNLFLVTVWSGSGSQVFRLISDPWYFYYNISTLNHIMDSPVFGFIINCVLFFIVMGTSRVSVICWKGWNFSFSVANTLLISRWLANLKSVYIPKCEILIGYWVN